MKVFVLLAFTLLLTGTVSASDQFSWLRDDSRSANNVLNYLNQQNNKTSQYQERIRLLSESLQDNWQGNRPERADKPWLEIGGYEYAILNHNGERVLSSRLVGNEESTELLNLDDRSTGLDYYQLAGWALNSTRTQLALAEDDTGSEQYRVSVVDLKTRQVTPIARNVDSTLAWSKDDQSLYLVQLEQQTSRPYALTQYFLDQSEPNQLIEEPDSAWLLSYYLSSDTQFAIVQANSEDSSEQRLLNLDTGEISKPFLPRRTGVEYYVDVVGSRLFSNSNHARKGFAFYSVALNQASKIDNWNAVFKPSDESRISNFHLFESGPVIITQTGASQFLQFFDNDGRHRSRQLIAEPGQVAWVSQVGDYQSNKLHIRSMSLTQPAKWERLNTDTLKRELFSQDHYPEYQKSNYYSEQVIVNSGGVAIPVTLAYRKDKLTKDTPLFLYGYGAYGMTMKPYFMPQIISLLDEGVIYAIAHVRGGGFYGDAWYQAGKGVKKENAISDFIAVARDLTTYDQGRRPIYAMGGSAGGTLVAAALNQAPDLFNGAVLKVPFVDVVNSMSDSVIPLTAQQYGEWGNPNIADELKVMQQYDPYLNLSEQNYPPILIQVGLNDRRVPYWEGAKYYAKLSELTTGSGPYLLSTNFTQGHSADRRRSQSQQAFEYAFLLSLIPKDIKAEQ
ncbi:putative Peptidase S9A, prolyl oligopeptidase [Vibrio coralliirubri]|uniref:prolyl oligopeptidase family serine peptidase n=1 Tax=Vibrio coralliirubri TaxID=1516159 RepID=UPI00063833A9|nr:prolyl oligopeptidase family serine peptidase [Vibrio coralliirubri]CDT99864.1 putative Peptidase S9A, prolyl oligopeptidase [Vibrio coralliirubri]